MKVKVNWRKLCQQLWEAAKPVLLAAIGGGVVTITAGCSSLSQTPRGQTTEIVAVRQCGRPDGLDRGRRRPSR